MAHVFRSTGTWVNPVAPFKRLSFEEASEEEGYPDVHVAGHAVVEAVKGGVGAGEA